MSTSASHTLPSWRQRLAADPDVVRGIRGTVAFMVPLLLAFTGWLPVNASFATITAQNLAMLDLRGDYRIRVGLLLAMATVFVGQVALGTLAAHHLGFAIAATIVVAATGGVWRHLSSDYGPALAISSTFVFLFALATPPGAPAVENHVVATAIGAAWGIAVQIASWPFHAQHPLRRIVSDSWVAVAELFDTLAAAASGSAPADHRAAIVEKESAVRSALDAANSALAIARRTRVHARLEAVHSAAARLAMQVLALDTALQAATADARWTPFAPALDPLLTSLSNLSRSVGLVVVSRQPAQFVTFEVRLRRLTALLEVARRRLASAPAEAATAPVGEILGQIERHLPVIHSAVRAAVDRANERAAASLELRDLRTAALRPLASALNLSWNVDPALIRFTYRSMVLTVLGVVAYKELHLPHGYWVPFTAIVVLQPDYGSTRRRAAQRMVGTLVGSVAASLLLWLRLPFPALMIACAATIFTFGFWLRRNYGVAVVFITLFVVLLTEAAGPVSVELAVERLGSTLAGGLLALLAAQLFWPVWERERLPPILATALRANSRYLEELTHSIEHGRGFSPAALAAKREVERANAKVFSSLTRLNGDPKNQREGLEHAATIANGNQRITRALNVLAVHLATHPGAAPGALAPFVVTAHAAFETVAQRLGDGASSPDVAETLRALEATPLPRPTAESSTENWVATQLTVVVTELSALLLATLEWASATESAGEVSASRR